MTLIQAGLLLFVGLLLVFVADVFQWILFMRRDRRDGQRWHPDRVRMFICSPSGGVAALNHRLRAFILPGCRLIMCDGFG